MGKYIIGIDQSTQGTKALLFDEEGTLLTRADLPHEQIINDKGWVEHNPEEFYHNTIEVVKKIVTESKISKTQIAGVGISNQRETSIAWDKTGKPIYNAIVWQCARGAAICDRIFKQGYEELIREHTGIPLSPYFPAAKIAWILENVPNAAKLAEEGNLHYGTVDSYLVYRLTKGEIYQTDYSNASRTQLFNINTLEWDSEVCRIFGIPKGNLPKVTDSDGYYGTTDFEGFLDTPVPIHGVLGDSHGALFGQGCIDKGMVKATYGTGSSIMMNVGEKPVVSKKGVVTSLAWGMQGKVNYVLEGNINYTGAVISWLKDDMQLIHSAAETEELARKANKEDTTYLVPAFSGLGAPYWDSEAKASISGMTRVTGKKEIVKAALDCIAHQITDIVEAMGEDAGIDIQELRVDGGPTKNKYLMEFQSDMIQIPVQVPYAEELSGIGAAYAAGISLGIYVQKQLFAGMKRTKYEPSMSIEMKESKRQGWKKAVEETLTK